MFHPIVIVIFHVHPPDRAVGHVATSHANLTGLLCQRIVYIRMLKVAFGHTGLSVSRLAIGTGTHGWDHASDQTRKGRQWLVSTLKLGHSLGVNFWDLADQYGSHDFARRALKMLPRGEIVINTKTTASDYRSCWRDVKRFLTELGTEYLDIVLLHGVSAENWWATHQGAVQALTEAKEQQLVCAVGVSCHGFEALRFAAHEPWVDVLLVRLNSDGSNMDDRLDRVIPVVRNARAAGKAIYAMKVLAQGELAADAAKAIQFVLDLDCVHALVVGVTEISQLRQNVATVEQAEVNME